MPGARLARALLEQSPLGRVFHDTDGHLRVANAEFERLFGPRLGVTTTTWTRAGASG